MRKYFRQQRNNKKFNLLFAKETRVTLNVS